MIKVTGFQAEVMAANGWSEDTIMEAMVNENHDAIKRMVESGPFKVEPVNLDDTGFESYVLTFFPDGDVTTEDRTILLDEYLENAIIY